MFFWPFWPLRELNQCGPRNSFFKNLTGTSFNLLEKFITVNAIWFMMVQLQVKLVFVGDGKCCAFFEFYSFDNLSESPLNNFLPLVCQILWRYPRIYFSAKGSGQWKSLCQEVRIILCTNFLFLWLTGLHYFFWSPPPAFFFWTSRYCVFPLHGHC